MELKPRISDYTQQEFSTFLARIWAVDTDKAQHDKLVDHFDKIVSLPEGADLLFYPEPDEFGLSYETGKARVISQIRDECRRRGQQAFKDDAPPVVRPRTPKLNARDYARADVLRKKGDIERIIAETNDKTQAAQKALDSYAQLLSEAPTHPALKKTDRFDKADFQEVHALLRSLEHRRHQVIQTLASNDRLDMTLRFKVDDAVRSAARPTYDHDIWTANQQMISGANEQYLAKRVLFKQRHLDLHAKSEQVFMLVEERLLRVAEATQSGPANSRLRFLANSGEADNTPRILTLDPSRFATYVAPLPALNNAVRSAVAGITWEAATSKTNLLASVVSFDAERPGCGDPFAISVPLETLMPTEGQDWPYLAASGAEVHLPFRIATGMKGVRHGSMYYGLAEVKELTHAYVVSMGGGSTATSVKVLHAHWDSGAAAYRCVFPGVSEREVIWTTGANTKPLATPASSTPPVSHGYLSVSHVPVIEALDLVDEVHFDDGIAVFPADSGIDPVYVTFKGNTEYPGVASGEGQPVYGNWLAGQRSAIPSQIAEQLRGRVFKRLNQFRAALWSAVAKAPELCAGLTEQDLTAMRDGKPPLTLDAQESLSARYVVKFIRSPHDGGGVYDMDNMLIVKP